MTLTPKQVRAARALLGWSQPALAKAARVGVSTLADFERAARRASPQTLAALQDTLEGQGLEFVAGSVVERDRPLPAPRRARPGALFRWIRADDLEGWSKSRDGQGGLPELIERLVYATVGPAARFRFPSTDSISQPGYDGRCKSPIAHPFIPQGESVWEISANGRPRDKASKDLVKRNVDPIGAAPGQTTYVVATSRRFPGRDAWLARERAKSAWRDIMLIDSIDLEQWLAACPAVTTWLATRLGRRPSDLRDLSEFGDDWLGATAPALTADILLTDRDVAGSAIVAWLNGAPAVLTLQGETIDEALAFLYAAIGQYPLDRQKAELSRAVLATDDAARKLAETPSPLLIALREPDPGLAKRLAAGGHHVFSAWGSNLGGAAEACRLARPSRHHLQEALEVAGVAEGRAHHLAHHAGGSFTTFRRITDVPAPRPTWAEMPGPALRAAMLAVSWSGAVSADRQVISSLSGLEYEHVERELLPLLRFGGPLLRSGDRWKMVSAREGWELGGDQLTTTDINRLEASFRDVLSACDPLDHPTATPAELQRLHDQQVSPELRAGLIVSVTALSLYGGRIPGLTHPEQRVEQAVRQVLIRADGAVWRSFADIFTRLAEASPKGFLTAIDVTLRDAPERLKELLGREQAGVFHDRPFQQLIGALELLAVSADHLRRCVRLLAQLGGLSSVEARGQTVLQALRKILLFWHPNTAASMAERLSALDDVLRIDPKLGWKLLVSLAPRDHDTTEPLRQPMWRDFSTDHRDEVTWESIRQGAIEVGGRLLAHVGRDITRWSELLELWRCFPPEWRRRAQAKLREVADGANDDVAREKLRGALRGTIVRSGIHPDSAWALPKDDLMQLEAVFGALEPYDVAERHRWLFSSGRGFLILGATAEQELAERARLQTEAARDLTRTLSPGAFVDFIGSIEHQNDLAAALTKIDLDQQYTDGVIRAGLLDKRRSVGDGVTTWLRHLENETPGLLSTLWEQTVTKNYGERAELRVLLAMPTTLDTWRLLERRSTALKAEYWRAMEPWWLTDDLPTFGVAMRELLEVGRADRVLSWLGSRREMPLPSELIIRALREIRPQLTSPAHTMQSHYLGQLFRRLDADNACERSTIAELEWLFFEDLRFSERKPRHLAEQVARSSEMFASLVKACFRPDPEAGLESEPEPSRETSRKAYGVLSGCGVLPGVQSDGMVDSVVLESWVKETLRLCRESGRALIGASKIGELLSRAPIVPGQPWPPEPVCEVIEVVRSRELERGFVTGTINGRGVTSRGLADGGQLERDEAARFRRDAETLSGRWLRIAGCLESIAEIFESQATMHDQIVERLEWP